jgi:hypothetical protein
MNEMICLTSGRSGKGANPFFVTKSKSSAKHTKANQHTTSITMFKFIAILALLVSTPTCRMAGCSTLDMGGSEKAFWVAQDRLGLLAEIRQTYHC